MQNTSLQGKNLPAQVQIDAALLQCKLLAIESSLTFLSGILFALLAITRMLRAVALLLIATFSFVLWCATLWQTALEYLLSLVVLTQQSLKCEVRYGE
jgi:hypothetical protein